MQIRLQCMQAPSTIARICCLKKLLIPLSPTISPVICRMRTTRSNLQVNLRKMKRMGRVQKNQQAAMGHPVPMVFRIRLNSFQARMMRRLMVTKSMPALPLKKSRWMRRRLVILPINGRWLIPGVIKMVYCVVIWDPRYRFTR